MPSHQLEHHVIELRSDTFTKPSKEMFEYMQKCEIGDSQYDEDPTITLLEKRTAELFGKEASLFMPSGTMANLVAAMVHCDGRGSEMIVGDISHFNLWEQGGIGQIGGIYTRQIETLPDGTYDLEKLESMLPDHTDRGCGHVKVVAIENSHNWSGGRILPLDYLEKLGALMKKRNVKLHVDGSRVATVSAATGIDIKTWVKECDSVNFCFSKAVGAPIGSILIGNKDFIAKAVRVRQSLGGGMRQAGVLAACCLYGLDHLDENLKKDLVNAKRLAKGIHDLKTSVFCVDFDNIETNIVHLKINSNSFSADDLMDRLLKVTDSELKDLKRSIAVKVGGIDNKTVRLLTHLDVNSNEIELALLKIEYVANEFSNIENQ